MSGDAVSSPHSPSVRPCDRHDAAEILEIVLAAAEAYRGVIPEDCFHDPYMTPDELECEMTAEVRFFGAEGPGGELIGVMGLQDVGDVTLIRHAYVRPEAQRAGVGGLLLRHLLALTDRPVLVGTWAAAWWAVAFYEKHGFVQVTPRAKDLGLRRYWDIPERQVETSVVLADERARVAVLGEPA